MKAHQLIADTLSEWLTVRHAPDLAHQLFNQLDSDEVERLAIAGFSDEIRKSLTKKINGVPQYSNVSIVNNKTGKVEKRYKQTGLFNEDDYRIAIQSYKSRSDSNLAVVKALIDSCFKKFGVRLSLFGDDEAAG